MRFLQEKSQTLGFTLMTDSINLIQEWFSGYQLDYSFIENWAFDGKIIHHHQGTKQTKKKKNQEVRQL